MRAVVITRNGGPEVLELSDWPAPTVGPGQLLVDVSVAGVNYRDVYEREGLGSYGGDPPFVAGVEGVGRVVALGEGVSGFSVGDRVGWESASGSYAEQVLVQAERAIPISPEVENDVAAAALLQGMTAHYLCSSSYPVADGDTVVVHAAAGGVGHLLTQMAKMRGGRVVATTSSESKAELARSAGADEVTGYEDFGEVVRRLTGEGAAAVYDGVGRATFEASLECLRPRGTLVLYGAASGPVPPFDLARLAALGSLYVTRPTLRHFVRTREELLARASEVFGWVAEGALDVRIGDRYPLERAREAHEDLESRRTTGKLLLLVG